MSRPSLEVADVFRRHGESYRHTHDPPLSERRVMRAIEQCRTAALGGHVERCAQCSHTRIAYNSCRNRHCPKCQGAERAQWLQDRLDELLPVEYFHLVFTLPSQLHALALQNQRLVYGLLFRISALTLLTIAGDRKHLGAEIGFFSILHTWGQNLLFHPHVHCVATGGGLAPDHERWIATKPGFFLPVRVLSALFRRLFLEALQTAFDQRELVLRGDLAALDDPAAFAAFLAPLGQMDWIVYSKPPFGGPAQVLAYLARYTHRVAIANERILDMDGESVTFHWKDYRKADQSRRMTLDAGEFIRRFLLHVVPRGFQRIRHYGLLANCHREDKLALCRRLLAQPVADMLPLDAALAVVIGPSAVNEPHLPPCPACGSRNTMMRVEVVAPVPVWNSS